MTVRSYCNPYPPRFSQAVQEARLSGDIYVEDKSGKVIDGLIMSIRKRGTIVQVLELGLLAPTFGKPRKRRTILTQRIEAILEKGAHIEEVATGHRSRYRQLPRMMIHAYEFIATSGRSSGNYDRPGRPGVVLTAQERELALALWTNRRYGNDVERITAIERRLGKKLKRGWLWHRFGSPTGRSDTGKH